MDALRTLEILVASRTPLIAIETLEEDRVEQALEQALAGRLVRSDVAKLRGADQFRGALLRRLAGKMNLRIDLSRSRRRRTA